MKRVIIVIGLQVLFAAQGRASCPSEGFQLRNQSGNITYEGTMGRWHPRKRFQQTCKWRFQNDSEIMKHEALLLNVENTNMADRDTCHGTMSGLVDSCSSVTSCRKVGCILHQKKDVKCDVSKIMAKFKCDSISWYIDDDLPNGFNFTTSSCSAYYEYHKSKMTVYYEYFNCTSKPVQVKPPGCSVPSEQLQLAERSNTFTYQISGKTERCMWRFPDASDKNALFLSVDFNTTDCSNGYLNIQGTGSGYNHIPAYAGTCHNNSMKCIMYQKQSSNCDQSQLKRNFECRPLSVLIVDRLPRIIYLRRNRASNVTMKLHYEYLKCPTGQSGPNIVPTAAEFSASPTSFSVSKQPVGHSATEGSSFKLDVTSFFIGFGMVFCISAVIVTVLVLKLRSDKHNVPTQREASIGARSTHESVLAGHQGIQAEESYYSNVPGSVYPNPALPEDGEGYLTPMQLQNLRARDVHEGF